MLYPYIITYAKSHDLNMFITQPSIYMYQIIVYFLLCHESLNYWLVNKFDYWLALYHGLGTPFPVKNTQALIDMPDKDARTVRFMKGDVMQQCWK